MARDIANQPRESVAKRILVIDNDAKAWELRSALLRAKGYRLNRITTIADVPPQWPRYLYDVVILAAAAEASEIRGFCQRLRNTNPNVRIALIVSDPAQWELGVPADAVVSGTDSATQIVEMINRLLAEA